MISGVAIAFLKPAGTIPSDRDQLKCLVIEGKRLSKHSLTKTEAHASNKQDFIGDFIVVFQSSSSETVLKKSNLNGSEGAESVTELVLEKKSLILVILSQKKVSSFSLQIP